MKVDRIFSAVAFTIAAVGFNAAHAGDEKIFPGSSCQPAHPSDAGKLMYTAAGVKNISSGSAKIRCPVVRENIRTPSGVIEVWLTGMREKPGSYTLPPRTDLTDWQCIFTATNHRGESVSSEVTHLPVNVGRVVRKLTGIDQSHVEAGHYSLGCWLPSGATFVEYEVEEY